MIHTARLERSASLRRVDALLADGEEHSILEIIHWVRVCAVNTIVAELRVNGRRIYCRQGNVPGITATRTSRSCRGCESAPGPV